MNSVRHVFDIQSNQWIQVFTNAGTKDSSGRQYLQALPQGGSTSNLPIECRAEFSTWSWIITTKQVMSLMDENSMLCTIHRADGRTLMIRKIGQQQISWSHRVQVLRPPPCSGYDKTLNVLSVNIFILGVPIPTWKKRLPTSPGNTRRSLWTSDCNVPT